MPVTDTPIANLDARRFGILHFKVALVWCVTIFGVAIAARASGNFAYELIVLSVGFSLSWAVIDATARRFRKEAAAIERTRDAGAVRPDEVVTEPGDRSVVLIHSATGVGVISSTSLPAMEAPTQAALAPVKATASNRPRSRAS